MTQSSGMSIDQHLAMSTTVTGYSLHFIDQEKGKNPHAWGLNDLPKINKPSWGQKKTGILIHDLHEPYLPYLKCHIKIDNVKETMSIIFFSFTLSDFHVPEISTKHVPVLEEKEVYSYKIISPNEDLLGERAQK